jgi:hypothetical protein
LESLPIFSVHGFIASNAFHATRLNRAPSLLAFSASEVLLEIVTG